MIDIRAQWKRVSELLFKKRIQSSLYMGLCISDNKIACAVYSDSEESGKKFIRQGSLSFTASESLSSVMLGLQNQYQLNNLRCYWTLCPKDYQLILIDKPKVSASEYKAVVLWQIKDMLEFPIADCAIDVFLPSEKILAHKNKLYVVVAKKSYLLSMIEILSSLNISVESILTEEFALRNIISFLHIQKEPIALLTNERNTYLLTIIQDNDILFSRRISDEVEHELTRSFEFFYVTLKQKAITKLYIKDMSIDSQNSLALYLEQSNYPMTIYNVMTLIKQLSGEDDPAILDCFYAMGAALQFNLEKPS